MFTKIASALAFAALVAAQGQRRFVVNTFYGKGPLVEGRVDPIVSPGGPSTHAHTIMGGDAFAMTMGDDTALGASCTNSMPKMDKSNYWWPKLYFHDAANNSFIDVPFYYAKVYYFFEATNDELKAFPPGLRMTAGNPRKRSPNASGGKEVTDKSQGEPNPARFMCSTLDQSIRPFGAESPDQFSGTGFPDANCDQTYTPMRYDIHFPSCYNPAVDVKDHENNMDWPTNGDCPQGWVHTPHIFIEVYWDTPQFKDMWTPGQGSQPFVLAQGDPTGYGLHADFLSGWDEAALQAFIDERCDAGHAGFKDCPSVNRFGGVYGDDAPECTMAPLIDEQVNGVLAALPGCNPIFAGPEDATPQTGGDCGGVAGSGAGGDDGSNDVDNGGNGDGGNAEPPSSSAGDAEPSSSAAAPSADAPQPTTLATAVLSPSSAAPVATSAPEEGSQDQGGYIVNAPVFQDHQAGPRVHTAYVTRTITENVYVTAKPRAVGQKARRHVHAKRHGY